VDSNRRISLTAGLLFLATFVTAIAALALFQPVLDDPVGYVAGAGSDNRIFFGAFLELLLIVANVGTAVVLFRSRGGRTRSSRSATWRRVSSSARSSRLASSPS
jgi:Domain of unknown function (DUF4386)